MPFSSSSATCFFTITTMVHSMPLSHRIYINLCLSMGGTVLLSSVPSLVVACWLSQSTILQRFIYILTVACLDSDQYHTLGAVHLAEACAPHGTLCHFRRSSPAECTLSGCSDTFR
jgi:hypothetical protein